MAKLVDRQDALKRIAAGAKDRRVAREGLRIAGNGDDKGNARNLAIARA